MKRTFLLPGLTLLEGRVETEPRVLVCGHLRNGISKEYELIICGADILVSCSGRGKLVCRHEARELERFIQGEAIFVQG